MNNEILTLLSAKNVKQCNQRSKWTKKAGNNCVNKNTPSKITKTQEQQLKAACEYNKNNMSRKHKHLIKS